jgi:hypothetical protein
MFRPDRICRRGENRRGRGALDAGHLKAAQHLDRGPAVGLVQGHDVGEGLALAALFDGSARQFPRLVQVVGCAGGGQIENGEVGGEQIVDGVAQAPAAALQGR